MNEVQGPTPAGTSRPYRSLVEALRAHRIDPVNHRFITEIMEAVGISSFIDRGRYIEAIRRGEGATLHIGRTYTNGFAENERIVVGSAPLRLQQSEALFSIRAAFSRTRCRSFCRASSFQQREGVGRQHGKYVGARAGTDARGLLLQLRL